MVHHPASRDEDQGSSYNAPQVDPFPLRVSTALSPNWTYKVCKLKCGLSVGKHYKLLYIRCLYLVEIASCHTTASLWRDRLKCFIAVETIGLKTHWATGHKIITRLCC